MDWPEVVAFVVFLLASAGLAAQAYLARKDQKKLQRAGMPTGSLWQHMRKLAEQRNAKAKPSPRKPERLAPNPPITHQRLNDQTSRAIATDWRIGEVIFTYVDEDGVKTERHVVVHSATATHIKGECLERRAERTFRVDRIRGKLVNCETGELMTAKDYVGSM